MKRIILLLILGVFISCGSDKTYEDQINEYNYHVSKADSLISVNEFKEAVAHSNAAIKITDTLPMAFFTRGVACVYLINPNEKFWAEDAEENLSKVIDIEGDASKAYKFRAMAYYSLKDSDFLDDIDQYIKNYPNDDEAHLLKRNYYEKNNDLDNAIEEYNLAIRKDKNNIDLYIKRSEIHVKNDDFEEALSDYNTILKLSPNNIKYVNKKRAIEQKINNIYNRKVFIGLLVGGYIMYLLLSFFILKPIAIKKAINQIGGKFNLGFDHLIWILPIIMVFTYIITL